MTFAVGRLPICRSMPRRRAQFLRAEFPPSAASSLGDKEGFFTGYYEPVVEGARYPSDVYNVPLYRRPNDMVTQRLRRSGAKAKAGKKV